jgi:hypothetical protein
MSEFQIHELVNNSRVKICYDDGFANSSVRNL